jgi:hypothetical protein
MVTARLPRYWRDPRCPFTKYMILTLNLSPDKVSVKLDRKPISPIHVDTIIFFSAFYEAIDMRIGPSSG